MDNVDQILIKELSGDEVAYVRHQDGTIEKLDSCPNGRWMSYEDGIYLIFRKGIFDVVEKFNTVRSYTDEEYEFMCEFDDAEFRNSAG